jgi:hypothetical protein
MKNAKGRARGLLRRLGLCLRRSGPAFQVLLMTLNRRKRHTETGAHTSRSFAQRSRQLEMAKETVRKPLEREGLALATAPTTAI